MLINLPLYEAYMDECQRFNQAVHHLRLRPTVYRQRRTYLVYYALIESDALWFHCYELLSYGIHAHLRVPSSYDQVISCVSEQEWVHLLTESDLPRSTYFQQIVSGKLATIPLSQPLDR